MVPDQAVSQGPFFKCEINSRKNCTSWRNRWLGKWLRTKQSSWVRLFSATGSAPTDHGNPCGHLNENPDANSPTAPSSFAFLSKLYRNPSNKELICHQERVPQGMDERMSNDPISTMTTAFLPTPLPLRNSSSLQIPLQAVFFSLRDGPSLRQNLALRLVKSAPCMKLSMNGQHLLGPQVQWNLPLSKCAYWKGDVFSWWLRQKPKWLSITTQEFA